MNDIRIELTDKAHGKFLEFLRAQDEDGMAIRLALAGRALAGHALAGRFQYELDVVAPDDASAEYIALDYEGFRMLVVAEGAENLDGVTIDFVRRGLDSGFHFDNPNSPWKDPVARAVQEVLDTQINPSIAAHGGFVTLTDVSGDAAYLTFGGGCHGCGMVDVTLKQGVEVAIVEAVPEIERVLDATDHATGENPYYEPAKDGSSPFG